MIDFVKGSVKELNSLSILIETRAGAGYRMLISQDSFKEFRNQNQVLVYTYVQFVNDQFFLYGFSGEKERFFFKSLIQVSGVGPKMAIRSLSQVSYKDFYTYILTQNAKKIATIPGIGLKKAEKIILEMKDRLAAINLHVDANLSKDDVDQLGIYSDAALALENFGFDGNRIKKSIEEVRKLNQNQQKELTIESLIKDLLLLLNKK